MKVVYRKYGDLESIAGKQVAIIGYGAQGDSHAQNLANSDVALTVSLRRGASWHKVKQTRLKVADAVKGTDLVMILLPDESISQVYPDYIAMDQPDVGDPDIHRTGTQRLREIRRLLAFVHGFNPLRLSCATTRLRRNHDRAESSGYQLVKRSKN
jgi:ketol-acid reductoisomerase